MEAQASGRTAAGVAGPVAAVAAAAAAVVVVVAAVGAGTGLQREPPCSWNSRYSLTASGPHSRVRVHTLAVDRHQLRSSHRETQSLQKLQRHQRQQLVDGHCWDRSTTQASQPKRHDAFS